MDSGAQGGTTFPVFLKAAERIAGTYAWSSKALATVDDVVRRGLSSALTGALSPDELAEITARMYGRSPPGDEEGLSSWEAAWWDEWLPEPDAKVLLGGAGVGRELAALGRLGLEVHAFEPVPELARRCQALVGEPSRIVEASYQQLSRAVLDGAAEPMLDELARERFDAAIIGFGTLTHVLRTEERARVFRAFDALCPTGPILATFFRTTGGRGEGIVERVCGGLGQRLGKVRGVEQAGGEIVFGAWFGFGRPFSKEEIERLAREIGRVVRWEPRGEPAAVLLVSSETD